MSHSPPPPPPGGDPNWPPAGAPPPYVDPPDYESPPRYEGVPQGQSPSQPPPPPPGPPPGRPLGDTIAGAVPHDVYSAAHEAKRAGHNQNSLPPEQRGLPPLAPPPSTPPSAWNLPAYGLLAMFLVALAALVYPQYRARQVEHQINPIVAGLSQRDASARCPRYITAIFTNVGSVSLDNNGEPSDHTDLTGPICDAFRHLNTPAGKAELRCLVTDGRCSETALESVIALSVVAHESMHLRGILDEAAAECASIGGSQEAARLAGLTPEEGQMIGYLHLAALNPNTPEGYEVTPEGCPQAAQVLRALPGTDAQRSLLLTLTEERWLTLGDH